MQRKYAAKAAQGRAASSGEGYEMCMRTGIYRKYDSCRQREKIPSARLCKSCAFVFGYLGTVQKLKWIILV